MEKKRGKLQYLIKWKGYADHENTWEKTEHLKTAIRLSKTTTHRDDALLKGEVSCDLLTEAPDASVD